jgi:peptidoglycan/xylan/chitin deacetylase (PgdA/CDA1 family)
VATAASGRIGFHLALLALAAALALRVAGVVAIPGWALGAAALALALVLFVGLYVPAAGLFARPLLRVPGAAGRLALTFDDGPDARGTEAVLAALARRGHRATFFVIGARAAAAPALCRAIVAAGCTIGNHTQRHSWATPFYLPRRLGRELAAAQAAVAAAAGAAARPRFVRPPVGLMAPWLEPAALRLGLRVCAFSARAGDASLWPLGAARVLARVRRAIAPGAIIALHDGAELPGRVPLAPAIIEEVLDAVEAAGLRSVTLEELTGR